MKKIIAIGLLSCSVSIPTFAADTSGYVTIKEFKHWGNKADVYLSDNQAHICGAAHSTRFQVDFLVESEKQLFSTLQMAFAEGLWVMLNYTCRNDLPFILGVRVRKYQ